MSSNWETSLFMTLSYDQFRRIRPAQEQHAAGEFCLHRLAKDNIQEHDLSSARRGGSGVRSCAMCFAL